MYSIYILYYSILYSTILYSTLLYTILYYTIIYYTILYYAMLCYDMLCYTIPYHTILYYTILFYIIWYDIISYYITIYIYYILCTVLVYNYIHTSSHWLEDHPALFGLWNLVKLPSWKTYSIFWGTHYNQIESTEANHLWIFLGLFISLNAYYTKTFYVIHEQIHPTPDSEFHDGNDFLIYKTTISGQVSVRWLQSSVSRSSMYPKKCWADGPSYFRYSSTWASETVFQASLCGPATFSESVFEALASRRNSLLVPFLTCLSRIISIEFHQRLWSSIKAFAHSVRKQIWCKVLNSWIGVFASWGRHRPTPKISPYSCHLRLPCAWSWQFLAGAVDHLPGPHETRVPGTDDLLILTHL